MSAPPSAVPPSSWAVIVTCAVPCAPDAGVNVSVPPGLTAGWAANSELLSLLVVKAIACDDSSAGPGVMCVAQPPTVCAGSSSRTVRSAPAVNVGASLTDVMVMVNVWGALVSSPPPSSWARTVTVAVPLASGAGV